MNMERFRIMSKQAKTSLKLPIFLLIGPTLGIVVAIMLYAIINFIVSDSSSASSNDVSVTGGVDSSTYINEYSSTFRTSSNILLYILGSTSIFAFVPCLVIGIIVLSKRHGVQIGDTLAAEHEESRKWKDLE